MNFVFISVRQQIKPKKFTKSTCPPPPPNLIIVNSEKHHMESLKIQEETQMIDQAGLRMDKGYQIACERIQGVNDNMAKSHYHEYFELYYLESGKRYHIADDTLYCLNSG